MSERHTTESRFRPVIFHLMMVALVWLVPCPAIAYLDLSDATVERLDNGLTLIMLEEHTLPVVSVQMLYRVGARNEVTGATGLAHFLEHMAFRSSQNFPDTQLAGSIYAAGGEWHAYTWLDQTTYFETAPRAQLELLLRIEADRMSRLNIPETDVPAERGAVLAEMHGYENDPKSVLHDNVIYLVFLAHPYRNNTIGWESDVAHISHADLVTFYRDYYQPGNAVLAVVGDVTTDEVEKQVRQHFGDIRGRSAAPPPHTVEPQQRGQRRIRLHGPAERKYFEIAYRAPAAGDPDYAAFLLAQELLAGGSGVSFLQNDWGTAVRPDAPLAGIADDVASWFPPAAQDYVFTIGGSVPAGTGESPTEHAIEAAVSSLRRDLEEDTDTIRNELEHAKERVRRALVFDVQTTEDAAHQLAFFSGLDALEVLIDLPSAIDRVTSADVARVIGRYLPGTKRTIGWYVPEDAAPSETATPTPAGVPAGRPHEPAPEQRISGPAAVRKPSATHRVPETAAPATLTHLKNGLPVMLQRVPLTATESLKVLVAAATFPAEIPATRNQPFWGVTSLDFAMLPGELSTVIDRASTALESALPMPPATQSSTADPPALLEQYFQDILGLKTVPPEHPGAPLLLVLTGDIEPGQVLPVLERGFGRINRATGRWPPLAATPQKMDIEVTLSNRVAQDQLGYIVRAPGSREPAVPAWKMALYILSHGYEGRLGKQAISRRGLLYYIDSAYQSDGRNGWVTLSMGVDPDKLPAMKALLRDELMRLVREPPSQQEVDEARQHLLGRKISAAQSNPERTDDLARQWLWQGKIVTYEALEQQLSTVSRQDVINVLPTFISGSVIAIRSPR